MDFLLKHLHTFFPIIFIAALFYQTSFHHCQHFLLANVAVVVEIINIETIVGLFICCSLGNCCSLIIILFPLPFKKILKPRIHSSRVILPSLTLLKNLKILSMRMSSVMSNLLWRNWRNNFLPIWSSFTPCASWKNRLLSSFTSS